MKAGKNRVEGMLAFAEALRGHALAAGCDLNVANMMVHTIVWRVLVDESPASEFEVEMRGIMDESGDAPGLVPLAA